MSNQIAERVKKYALNSTYEISCLTNMAKVAEEVGELRAELTAARRDAAVARRCSTRRSSSDR